MNIKEILQNKNKTDEFLESNKGLVIKTIQKIYPSVLDTYEREDYIQEGMISLYQAMQKYNESKNIKFSTFAYLVIKMNLIKKIKCQQNRLHQYKNNVISLNQSINKFEDESLEMMDILKSNEDMENDCINLLRYDEMVYLLNTKVRNRLNPQDSIVLNYLLEGKNQADIGRIVGCTRENIRQRVKKIKEMCLKMNVA